MNRTVVEIGGSRLPLTNLGKDLYPSHGFTKDRVLEYYRRVAPFMLPHLRDRPVTFKRYPEGAGGEHFYEKRCPSHRPSWVRSVEVRHGGGEPMQMCVVDDLRTLLWAENLAALELHVPLARAGDPGHPDSLVFDLDPGNGAGLLECSRVALVLRDLLIPLGIESVVKTSGMKGLHVLVPLRGSEASYEETKTFSRTVSGTMEKHYPDLVTMKMAKHERAGKVFINWSQNDSTKTMVCVYSLRAREYPSVSFPLAWEEVERAVRRGEAGGLQITPEEALRRLDEQGDLFEKMLTASQALPHR